MYLPISSVLQQRVHQSQTMHDLAIAMEMENEFETIVTELETLAKRLHFKLARSADQTDEMLIEDATEIAASFVSQKSMNDNVETADASCNSENICKRPKFSPTAADIEVIDVRVSFL